MATQKRRTFRAIMVGTLVIFVYGLFQAFGPSPAIKVSPDTTVITSPQRADGMPDYREYWLNFGREGVTPENNGAVLFWRATWPGELGQQYRQPMCDILGIKPMPFEHESLQDPHSSLTRYQVATWLTEHFQEGLSPDDAEALFSDENQKNIQDVQTDSLIGDAMTRPWTSEQVPPLADWVNSSEKPFALLTEASQRPKWWSPSPSLLNEDEYNGALSMLLPGVQRLRSVGRAYSIRAMWHAGEGRPQEAWNDLKTSMRFARQCSQGLTLVEQLVGIAIDAIALRQTATFLHHCEPDAELARQVLADLNAFEKPSDVVRSFDKGERLFFADTVIMLARNGNYLKGVDLGLGTGSSFFDYNTAWLRIDWNIVLRDANKVYNQFLEAAKLPTFQERRVGLVQFESELSYDAGTFHQPGRVVLSCLDISARSVWMADALISLMMPALNASVTAEERATVFLDLTRVAAALAVYRAEHGEYPDKLEDLVPSVLEKLPEDLYTGNPFKYSRKPDGGYVLYSVYENGTDDRGTNYDGQIIDGEWVDEKAYNANYEPGDLVIRVPAPAFKLPPSPILNQ